LDALNGYDPAQISYSESGRPIPLCGEGGQIRVRGKLRFGSRNQLIPFGKNLAEAWIMKYRFSRRITPDQIRFLFRRVVSIVDLATGGDPNGCQWWAKTDAPSRPDASCSHWLISAKETYSATLKGTDAMKSILEISQVRPDSIFRPKAPDLQVNPQPDHGCLKGQARVAARTIWENARIVSAIQTSEKR
jgi:hypothetical protein